MSFMLLYHRAHFAMLVSIMTEVTLIIFCMYNQDCLMFVAVVISECAVTQAQGPECF